MVNMVVKSLITAQKKQKHDYYKKKAEMKQDEAEINGMFVNTELQKKVEKVLSVQTNNLVERVMKL